jgi:iron complex transport system ATP-binding protein
MSAEMLAFERVSYGYPNREQPVFSDFSLGIPPGGVTAILGPNGVGKTTLLGLTLGWLKPRQGSIRLNGNPLEDYSRRELGQWIGIVPQSEHIPFEFSLLEYVLLGRAPHLKPLGMPGEADTRLALEVLDQVGLGVMAAGSVQNLSGGEKQLAPIARALAQQPRLLLLDEPTSHLDIHNKARLRDLLRRLHAQGMTILFTTHEPDFAAALATHLVLMQKGRILGAGAASAVLTTANLSCLYGTAVDVRELDGRQVVLWN